MSRPRAFAIHEQECSPEGWDDPAARHLQWRTLISGDRTPTADLTVGVAELEPSEPQAFRLHRHAQAEVYYVLSGEGIVAIRDTEYPVRAGSTVYIPGGTDHGARNTGSEVLRLLYVFPSDSFADIEYEFSPA